MQTFLRSLILVLLGSVASTAGFARGGFLPPGPSTTISITPVATSIPANTIGLPVVLGSPFFTQVNVEARFNGRPVADGTIISLRVDNVMVGAISTLDDPATTTINEFTTLFGQTTAATSGGFATFFFHSLSITGTVTLTASTNDPNSNDAVTASTTITVTPGPVPADRIQVSADATSLPAHTAVNPVFPTDSPFNTRIVVRLQDVLGALPPDGSLVTLRVNPGDAGLVSRPDDPTTSAVNEFIPLGIEVQTPVLSGQATFFFHSTAWLGTAQVEAVFAFPVGAGSVDDGITVQENILINVLDSGVPPMEQLAFVAQRSRIPANFFDPYTPFIGSPFTVSVVAQAKAIDGTVVPNATSVAGSMPLTGVASISTLDDPATTNINEFTTLFGTIPAPTGGGNAQFFVHSDTAPGVATFTASFLDPVNGQQVSNSIDFEVIDTPSNGLPASIGFRVSGNDLYIQDSGGNTSKTMQLVLTDGGDEPVLDPLTGQPGAFNNLQIELLDDGPRNSATLSTVDALGNTSQGRQVFAATVNGRAGVALMSGGEAGTQTVLATADRADNNVDNGIQDPVTATHNFVISDGRLFDITIVSPHISAIVANRVDPTVVLNPPPAPGTFPPDLDGTYSLTVSALGTDRLGNPVAPGTEIQFGLVDFPLLSGSFPDLGPGFFAIQGTQGDPVEGGVDFTSVGALLQTDGGGTGPGDSLLLFGEQVQGNRDLESRRQVASVANDSMLSVTRRFNLNDDTGSSVDNGPVLPFIVGRAVHGNITASAITDSNGVATVTLNYPANQLGRSVVLYAQSNADIVSMAGARKIETAADVATMVYPGIAPLSFSATPESLPANTTNVVQLCLIDATRAPVAGVFIGFQFSQLGGATGSVDGVSISGTVQQPTGLDGCTTATVTTAALIQGANDIQLDFIVGALTATVMITAPLDTALFANPSRIVGSGTQGVNLRLVNSAGQGIDGVQIIEDSCTTTGTGASILATPPGVTGGSSFCPGGGSGSTCTTMTAVVDLCGEVGSASCTFTTASGMPQATVTFQGTDVCPSGLVILSLSVSDTSGQPSTVVTSNPVGISCDAAGAGSCFASFNMGSTVVLQSPAASAPPTWGAPCVVDPGDPRKATIALAAAASCTATF